MVLRKKLMLKKKKSGVPTVAQQVKNPTSTHEDAGSIPSPLSGLRIWYCCELWCRSQMQLESGIPMAMV